MQVAQQICSSRGRGRSQGIEDQGARQEVGLALTSLSWLLCHPPLTPCRAFHDFRILYWSTRPACWAGRWTALRHGGGSSPGQRAAFLWPSDPRIFSSSSGR